MVNRLIPLDVGNRTQFEKYLVAGSELTPVCALVMLSSSKCARVRQRVAENPSTPISILAKLSWDDSADVRLAVAENKRTPIGLLIILARD